MGKLRLWVICKHCGREYETGRVMDRKSFEKGTLAANYHVCPHCGQKLTYRKADYMAREELSASAQTRKRANAKKDLGAS